MGFFRDAIIPTRCRNLYLKQFCLDIICSYFSDYFDCAYYLSCTMDAYQNLISGDKLPLGVLGNCCGWLLTEQTLFIDCKIFNIFNSCGVKPHVIRLADYPSIIIGPSQFQHSFGFIKFFPINHTFT